MNTPRPTLTARELAIMNVIWRANGATVRDVHTALASERPVAYTTVMTLMRILESKGYLKKHQQERAYFYLPTRKKHFVIRAMVRDFVDRTFEGTTQSLRLHLVRHETLTEADRAELKRVIDGLGEA